MSEVVITVQNLKAERFELTCALSDTVAQLKQKIETDLNLGIPASSMRVILTGSILEDGSQTLADAGISESNRLIVIMKSRRKKGKKSRKPRAEAKVATPAPTPAPTTPAPATPAPVATPAPSTTSSTPTPAPAPATPVPATDAPTPSTETKQGSSQPSSAMVVGEELQSTIAELMSLGDFSMAQVQAALRAAFNNPERAAEYLFTGIPANLMAPQSTPSPQATPQQAAPQGQQDMAQLAQSMQGANMDDQGQPSMEDMQQLLSQNPQFLQAIMQNMSQENPQLMQQLANNPQAFMQMMQMFQSMGRGQGGMPGMPGAGAGGQGVGGMPPQQSGGHGGPPPGAHTVTLTQAERQSLDNLQALAPGISQQQALQAFLVCDRNEGLAANFLLDQIFN